MLWHWREDREQSKFIIPGFSAYKIDLRQSLRFSVQQVRGSFRKFISQPHCTNISFAKQVYPYNHNLVPRTSPLALGWGRNTWLFHAVIVLWNRSFCEVVLFNSNYVKFRSCFSFATTFGFLNSKEGFFWDGKIWMRNSKISSQMTPSWQLLDCLFCWESDKRGEIHVRNSENMQRGGISPFAVSQGSKRLLAF